MQTGLLSGRLKKTLAVAALLALVGAPLAIAAQSGALKARSGYEEAAREYRDAVPAPDRAIHFRGECSYEEHVRVSENGWTLVEHVMRCIEKIPPRPCLAATADGTVEPASETTPSGHPAERCGPEPVPCAASASEPATARGEPRGASDSPRPCPPPAGEVAFALVGPDGRRPLANGEPIPLAEDLELVARSRLPAALHFVALRDGEQVLEWDAKVGPGNAFAFAVARLAHLDATEISVRAAFENGSSAGYHFRLVEGGATPPVEPQPVHGEPAQPAEPTHPDGTARANDSA